MSKNNIAGLEELENDEELKGIWVRAKEERKKIKKATKKFIIIPDIVISVIVIVFAIIIKGIGAMALPFIIVPVLIVNIITYTVIAVKNGKEIGEYNKIFKDKIINKIFNATFDDVDYVPLKPMPENVYNEVEYESYDRYHSDDYVEGKIDNKYKFVMAEVTTEERRVEEDSNGNTTTKYVTLFSGLFIKINIGKSINNQLIIGGLGAYSGGLMNNKEYVTMDSSEFRKYFSVISSDKILAMRILTADIMEMLVDFREKIKSPLDIYIKNNILYIRIAVGSMFEGNVNTSEIIDKKLVQSYFEVVDFIYSLSTQIIKVVEETDI